MRLSSTGLVVQDKFVFIHGDQKHLERAARQFGSVKLDEKHGRLQVYLSKTNLIKIGQMFNPRPQVVKGQEFIDALKDKVSRWAQQGDLIRRVLAKQGTMRQGEQQLILPHGYSFKAPPRDHQHKTFMLLDKCPYLNVMLDCFLPGTLIKSGSKYKNIEDMKCGDEIETLAGVSCVERVMNRKYSGEILEISTSSGFFPLKVTPNHKFYVLRKKRCTVKKRENTACSILCTRSCDDRPHKNYRIEIVRADELTENDCLLYLRPKEAETYNIDNKMLKIIGYYLSEGWLGYRYDKHGDRFDSPCSVYWGFNVSEKDTYVDDLVICLASLGHQVSTFDSKNKNNVEQIYSYDPRLATYLLRECGSLSHSKRLPSFTCRLSRDQRIELLRTLFFGDACIKEVGGGVSNQSSEKITYVTASQELALGVRDLLLSVGIRCSAWTERAYTDKNGTEHRLCYRILIPRKYMAVFGYDIKHVRSDFKQDFHQEYGSIFSLIPVREIKKSTYSGKVYNLTSAGHDSYLTEAGTSKNCGTGKTFILLTSTEYKIQKGDVKKGKTLVTGPLSVISSAWLEDAAKFTNLKVGILWTDKGTKEILGDKFLVKDFGPKPIYCIGNKKKKLKQWRSRKDINIVKGALDPFDDPSEWEEMLCHWNEAKNSETGESVAFGKMYARTRTTASRKKLHIEQMLADPSYDIYVINHDGARIHWETLVKHGFEQVIVDESTKIKNPHSKVFKAHLKISAGAKYRYVMSGTPAPNGAYDLWSQFFFTDRGLTLEPSIKDFREMFFEEVVIGYMGEGAAGDGVGAGKEIKKYVPKSEDSVREIALRLMSGSVRYRQDECLDLPKRQNLPVPVLMSVEQTRAYVEMEQALIAEFVDKNGEKKVIEASVALVKMLRLRQITSGFAKASEKDDEKDSFDLHVADSIDDSSPKLISEFPENPKMDALESLLDQIGENKMIVITNYQHEIDMICKKFPEFNPMSIDGRTKGKDRPGIITKFQTDPNYRLIVLHPAAAGHGITLTAARYMTFFSMTNNYEHEYQAAKRIERFGQQHEMTMYYMQGRLNPKALDLDDDSNYDHSALETVDHVLYNLVREKEAIQTQLIDKKPVKDFDWATAATNEIFEQITKRQEYVERISSRPEGFDLEESVQGEDGLL